MPTLSDDELANLSDEERAALGDDDAGDTDANDREAEKIEAEAQDDAPEPAAKPAAAEAAPEKADAPEAPEAPEDDETAPRLEPVFTAQATGEHADRISELEASRKDIRAKWTAGDLTGDQYHEQLDALNKQIVALEVEQRVAAQVEQLNDDLQRREYRRLLDDELEGLRREKGTHYAGNDSLLSRLDRQMQALADERDANGAYLNETRSLRWFVRQADERVRGELAAEAQAAGFTLTPATPAAPAAKPAAQAPAREAVRKAVAQRRPPLPGMGSLATVPSADAERPGSSEFAELDSLLNRGGEDIESALARMTPEQADRYLRTQ